LGGERIDFIPWNDDPRRLIALTLSPAQLHEVILHHSNHKALVFIAEDQMHVALGRDGENRELASRVSDWRIELVVR
jgi:N utilization substance protein A